MNKLAAACSHSCIIWVCKSRWWRTIVVFKHCLWTWILNIYAYLFWINLQGEILKWITIPCPLNCNSKFSSSNIIWCSYWSWIILIIVIWSNSSLSTSINWFIDVHLEYWNTSASSEALRWYYILRISYGLKVNWSQRCCTCSCWNLICKCVQVSCTAINIIISGWIPLIV